MRAQHLASEADPVHEYLIDQANLRGYRGAFSSREDLGQLDDNITTEDIVVGLLQPHAPVEPRVIKLVVRILQSGHIDTTHLVFLARRERALPMLIWLVDLIPDPERTTPIVTLKQELDASSPPRNPRRPTISYAPERLLKPKHLRPTHLQ